RRIVLAPRRVPPLLKGATEVSIRFDPFRATPRRLLSLVPAVVSRVLAAVSLVPAVVSPVTAIVSPVSAVTAVTAVLALTAFTATDASADVFVELGVQSSRVEATIALQDEKIETTDTGLHVGVGASRAFGERSEIGVRLELDDVGGDLLLALRALDYRRHINERLAVGAFIGAARLDLATPAYGYYLGGGVQLKEIMPSWDLGLDLRFGDKVARDNLLPEDPQGGSPDNFYDITSVSLYLRRRF